MKKTVYKGLYAVLLRLTNSFNNRLLSRYKIFLGTTLLLLMSNSCKKDNEPEIMCYDMPPSCYIAPPPEEVMQPRPVQDVILLSMPENR